MKSVNQAIHQALGIVQLDSTFLREETCKCGEIVKVYRMMRIFGPNKGQEFEARLGCLCEEKELARKAEIAYEQAKKMRRIEVFDRHSLISQDLKKATLGNYEPKNVSQSRAKKIADRYIEIFDIDEPRNIVFSGSFGLGKSHLAKAIADGVIAKGYHSIFISVPKLLRKFRATYNRNAEYTEDDLTTALEEVDLLVLDDIGAEKKSGDSNNDWAKERLFDVIDSRQGKHTIYTTNYSADDLLKLFGERIFSRIFNRDTTIVEIEGENHRLADVLKEGAHVG